MVRFKGGNGFVITDVSTSAVKSINRIHQKKFVFCLIYVCVLCIFICKYICIIAHVYIYNINQSTYVRVNIS